MNLGRLISRQLISILKELGPSFYFLWFGETITLLGTSLLEFALGVWAYQKTGSVLDFSGVIVAAMLPTFLVMPYAGWVIDRFDRRYVIIIADLSTAVLTLLLIVYTWDKSIHINYLYAFNAIVSIISAFRMPAYNASLSKLLPKEKYTRASGLIGMSSNFLSMFSPILAGLLMTITGLGGVMLIDLLLFCFGSVLVLKAFSSVPNDKSWDHLNDSEEWQGILSGFKFLQAEPILLGLLLYVILQEGLLNFVATMITPLALATYNEQQLGIILSCGSIGGLCGSLLLTSLHNLKRLMVGALIADSVLALSILIAGFDTSFFLYCSCAFTALFAAGFAEGCSRSLWMRKIPNDYQGRVFLIIESLSLATCTAITFLGALATEKLFEPALAERGSLASTVGTMIGTGQGRGLGLLFIICGLTGLMITFAAFATKMRSLDSCIKDAA